MPRFLCVGYHFPPIAASGTARTVGFVKHLPDSDWFADVLTVKSDPDFPRDDAMLDTLPSSISVTRTDWVEIVPALKRCLVWSGSDASISGTNTTFADQQQEKVSLKDFCSDLASWPDKRAGWIKSLWTQGARIARRRHCRLIYVSGPPWSAVLGSTMLARRTGLPLVLDFRDPWARDPWLKHVCPSPALRRLHARAERWCIRTASAVVCNTPQMQRDFAATYPARADKFVSITNGYDPEALEGLPSVRPVGSDRVLILHTGNFYHDRKPHYILEALANLRRESASSANRLALEFLGGPTYHGEPLIDIVRRFGLDDQVRITPTVPRQEALARCNGADVLLVIGYEGEGSAWQVPAKLYEYLGIGKSLLVLARKETAISDMSHCSRAAVFSAPPYDVGAITAALGRIADQTGSRLDSAPPDRNLSRPVLSRQLADVFHRAK